MATLYPPEQNDEATAELAVFFPSVQEFFRKLAKLVMSAGLDLLLVAAMAILLGVLLIAQHDVVQIAESSVLYPIGMMLFLLATRMGLWGYRHFRNQNGTLSLGAVFLQTLRDWIPFILIDFIYENLHDLSRHFQTHDVAATLMRWDTALFGVEPTLWIQRYFNPTVTDFMAFAYGLYFLLPLVIMYLLSYRNQRSKLREMILALSLSFLIAFVGFTLFPCSPPRYFIENQFTHPSHLYGLYLFNFLQAQWDNHSAVRSGAFPSLHVTTSAIALIYAFRLRNKSRVDRWLYWIYVPLVVSLWVSTVYLRHHWFIDIFAGWILALLCCWMAPTLSRLWEELRGLLDERA